LRPCYRSGWYGYIIDFQGLKAFTQEGTLKWTYQIYGFSNSICIADDGTIYLGRDSGSSFYPILEAINPNGTKKWEVKKISDPNIRYDQCRGLRSPSAVGADGTIYFGEKTGDADYGFLYSVNADGSIRWTYKAKKGFPGSPIVDAEGKVYAVSGSGDLYCFDSNGTLLWKYNISITDCACSYPAIDSLGTLYAVAAGKLCAFFKIDPANSPDLLVQADGIRFEPESGKAAAGTAIKMTLPVKETSGKQSAAFEIVFYADDLSHAIDTVKAYAPPGFTTHVEGTWYTEGFKGKTYQIIAVVKNANPAESNTSNNQVQTSYQLLPSLQERIDAAQAGDTIWVAPGRYYENLTLKKGIVVKSTHGPEQTIIDGRKKDSVVKALHLDRTAVIDGFTLTNGYHRTSGGGGGVYIERGGVTIRNCIIRGNEATEGGAIWMIGSFVESDPLIENNLIIDNHASFDGGAIYANNSWALVRNNTIINNRSSFSEKTGGIHARGFWSPSPDIVNCIIWGNGIDLGETAAATYSNIEDGDAGTGNISVDPMFVDPSRGDYHLQAGSPCIDARDPASPRDPDGTRADMGWKYYDQSATIAQIKGRLTDATTGAPVTMAKIYLAGPRTDLVPPDAQGNYVFAVPADTGYAVRVYAPNHSSSQKEHLTAKIGEATVADFALVPYPSKITLYPPSDLQGSFASGKVHLTWQRPKDEMAFDDGFYEESVGFLNSQGILAAGPFKPLVYPAKIEKIKVAFDGERAGDKIELLIYLDGTGTATTPASSQLVYTLPNIPIEVGGGFQEIDVTAEGLTLNSGSFFVGIKQVNTVPFYLLVDHSAVDGHAFFDDNLDGNFAYLSSAGAHGALAIRAIVSMPSGGSSMAVISKPKALSPAMMMPDSARLLVIEKNLPTGLVTKPLTNLKSDRIASEALALFMTPAQSMSVYRSATSPVELSGANKIATLAATATSYDDMSLGSSQRYYYVVTARYPSGEIVPSNEIYVDISTGVSNEDNRALPEKYALSQNTPNPFNPETVIQYQLPRQAEVRLEIYNLLGELVKTLVDEKQSAGYYSVSWNGKDEFGRDVASGLYFCNLKTNDFVQMRKMVLVR